MTLHCSKCQQEKPYADFKSNNLTGKPSPWCVSCRSEYDKNRWKNLLPEKRTQKRESQTEKRTRNRKFLWEQLQSKSCEICLESDPRVLEFDHISQDDKLFNVSDGASRAYSISKIEREIAKCRVLCANCHRRHTYEQQGWRCF